MTVSELPDTAASTDAGSPWSAAAEAFSRWRDGDSEGLDDLVRLLSPVLWQVVRATGLGPESAEDVVQTTWIALVDHADSITSPQGIAAWLCTSARREAWRAGRKATRERPVDEQLLSQELPIQESPERQVLLDDEAALLRTCLKKLPDRCQKLLRIVAAGPRPNYNDVARVLEMPVGSIGPTRARCLDKLRHELALAGGR